MVSIQTSSIEKKDNLSVYNLNYPIIKSDNFGHIEKKIVIPIGTNAKIDTSKKLPIELLEKCVK